MSCIVGVSRDHRDQTSLLRDLVDLCDLFNLLVEGQLTLRCFTFELEVQVFDFVTSWHSQQFYRELVDDEIVLNTLDLYCFMAQIFRSSFVSDIPRIGTRASADFRSQSLIGIHSIELLARIILLLELT